MELWEDGVARKIYALKKDDIREAVHYTKLAVCALHVVFVGRPIPAVY
jgi:hypothetical protein